MSNNTVKVVLKLSGEVLAGPAGSGLDPATLSATAEQLVRAQREGARAALILGGGNIFRGLGAAAEGMDRVTGDEMGMLATVINGLALKDAIQRAGGIVQLFTARPMSPIGQPYVRDDVKRAMNSGTLVILAGGTGNPFFSTDSGAALRAAELNCDLFLKGTKVDGVYDKDPAKHDDAQRYDALSFDEMIEKKLGVMDLTAATLLLQNNVSALVYKMTEPDAIYHAALGKCDGTKIHP
ncbi:MAG: UMP kinase [Deltaproteobacteria bacterium]|nr:UMP kinase [Deltaproteobacteria bacterium]MBN2674084.1 UMP kinase [Deltaproteobacteria bacterium]